MTTEDVKRKLTAILCADVQGYSRLMGDDERATVETITAYRKVMTDLIQEHHGRVVDAKGDNVLAEFSSVVDATQCAVEIQKELKVKNADLPEHRRMAFRIGVNLGDVIEKEDTIYGDGVNIAARLESLAEGGGICISGTAFDQVGKKLPLGYEFLGEQTVKNIENPIRVYKVLVDPKAVGKVIGENRRLKMWHWTAIFGLVVLIIVGGVLALWEFYVRPDVAPASIEKMAYPLPDKPSIAVLPFDNMSKDPEQDYFCDGITEEIITALAKVPDMFVIAPNTTFTYKGKPVEVKRVAEELGVQYVLEGSVRKSEDRIRVTAQLIDALTGKHLWAERYDRELKDIFAVQDEITMSILTALRVKLTVGEQARFYTRGTNNLEAYLKVMKAYEHIMQFNKNDNELGRQLYKEAIALDPNYANAYADLAWTHWCDVGFGWTKTPRESIKKIMELNMRAISMDEINANAHIGLGSIYSLIGEFEKAMAEAEKAIALEPNGADVNALYGMILAWAGRSDQAIERHEKAERLNPISPAWYYLSQAIAYRCAGKYEKAIESAKKFLKKSPKNIGALLNLTAAYILTGRVEGASAVTEEILKVSPKFSLDQWAKLIGPRYKNNKADFKLFIDALRKAGLK